MEENCQYGIWKNRLPFHTMPCLVLNKRLIGRGGRSATSATSAIAEFALRLIVYFETLQKLHCGLKALKFCCVLIALHFETFWLTSQFYSSNLILLHFERNIDKCLHSVANYLLIFWIKS